MEPSTNVIIGNETLMKDNTITIVYNCPNCGAQHSKEISTLPFDGFEFYDTWYLTSCFYCKKLIKFFLDEVGRIKSIE